jgi:hypothetical protein
MLAVHAQSRSANADAKSQRAHDALVFLFRRSFDLPLGPTLSFTPFSKFSIIVGVRVKVVR